MSDEAGLAARRALPWRRRTRPLLKWLWLAPLLAWMAAFGLYPLTQLVRMSLSKVTFRDGEFLWTWSGLSNFEQEARDAVFGISLQNTAIFIAGTTATTVAVGLILALLVDRARLLGRLGRNVLLWPAIIAPVAVSVIWWLILSPEFGLLNSIFDAAALPRQSWLGDSSTALTTVMLVDIWHWTPLVFVILYASVKQIDPDLYEAARVDGASELQIVGRVTIPLLAPSLIVAAGIRVVMGIKVFDELYLLTHGGPGVSSTVISLYINSVFFGSTDLGYGAALGLTVVVGLLVGLILGWVARRAVRRVRGDTA